MAVPESAQVPQPFQPTGFPNPGVRGRLVGCGRGSPGLASSYPQAFRPHPRFLALASYLCLALGAAPLCTRPRSPRRPAKKRRVWLWDSEDAHAVYLRE